MSRFKPRFQITSKIAAALMRIEAAKEAVRHLPITPAVLATLRETARLYSTHYSTMIEGNRLTQEQVSKVLEKHEHFPGKERDEKEVLGYYAALEKVEQLAAGEQADHRTADPAFARAGDGGRRSRVKPTLIATAKTSFATAAAEESSICRRRQGCSRADEGIGGVDQRSAAAVFHARSGPASPTINSPRSIPITTATAGPPGFLPR